MNCYRSDESAVFRAVSGMRSQTPDVTFYVAGFMYQEVREEHTAEIIWKYLCSDHPRCLEIKLNKKQKDGHGCDYELPCPFVAQGMCNGGVFRFDIYEIVSASFSPLQIHHLKG